VDFYSSFISVSSLWFSSGCDDACCRAACW